MYNLLDALSGIAYITDSGGTLLATGGTDWAWNSQANADGCLSTSGDLLGLNIFEIIQGPSVAAAYRLYVRAVCSGHRQMISFAFRCDTPLVRRLNRMSISALQSPGGVPLILFQSTLILEEERPPINLFHYDFIHTLFGKDQNRPSLTICSFCHDLKSGSGECVEGEGWLSPAEYYRRGGTEEVRITHGICPACDEEKVQPYTGE